MRVPSGPQQILGPSRHPKVLRMSDSRENSPLAPERADMSSDVIVDDKREGTVSMVGAVPKATAVTTSCRATRMRSFMMRFKVLNQCGRNEELFTFTFRF